MARAVPVLSNAVPARVWTDCATGRSARPRALPAKGPRTVARISASRTARGSSPAPRAPAAPVAVWPAVAPARAVASVAEALEPAAAISVLRKRKPAPRRATAARGTARPVNARRWLGSVVWRARPALPMASAVAVAAAPSPRGRPVACCSPAAAWRVRRAATPPTVAQACARWRPAARPPARPCPVARSSPSAARMPRAAAQGCVAATDAAKARAVASTTMNAANRTTTAARGPAGACPKACSDVETRPNARPAASRARSPASAAIARPCARAMGVAERPAGVDARDVPAPSPATAARASARRAPRAGSRAGTAARLLVLLALPPRTAARPVAAASPRAACRRHDVVHGDGPVGSRDRSRGHGLDGQVIALSWILSGSTAVAFTGMTCDRVKAGGSRTCRFCSAAPGHPECSNRHPAGAATLIPRCAHGIPSAAVSAPLRDSPIFRPPLRSGVGRPVYDRFRQ
jgi:hypothetical protein